MVAKAEIHEPCFVCGESDHLAKDCLAFREMKGVYEEQCNALGTYNKPFSNTYNPGWRNHPNFSWKDPNQAQSSGGQWRNEHQNQPSKAQPAPQYNSPPQRSSLENTVQSFMEEQTKINRQMMEEIKEMKSQFSKLTGSLAISERGKLPSQPQFNAQGQHMAQTSSSNDQIVKEANAITTRSGKTLEDQPRMTTTSKSPHVVHKSVPSNASAKVPFPQALRPAGKNIENRGEILEHLTQVKINLPLLHVIKQVPTYAKIIKDLCTVKRKHHVKKTAFLTEQVSAVIEQKTPLKYKDPGCPTISCQIGTHEFSQALLDLGASVNLMPYSVYSQLGLGEIKPTFVVLQLADRSIKKPRGIVEDVLVQVDKFYYPVDFLILDTQSVVNMESKIPIILGRPFLATANALINCRNGLMKISFGNMTLEVNIFHVAKQPHDDDECYQTFLIDTLISEEIQLQKNSDDLDELFSVSESSGFNESINEISCHKDSQNGRAKFRQPRFEELPGEREKPKPSTEEVPTVKLAQLPEGLKHVFLGDGDTFPVIISSKLDPSQEMQLVKLLKKHKPAIGWMFADIKGISPLICSHRIKLEEGAVP
ncbi:uncharacterized protein LOC133039746 [Cannabis sativa]|uniref:uncharacterized protein LOC133039746 n=1 Tax=Cannabis sativa TaxID=3483 RepID=UPI0029C9DB4F|nr:uncharacterized protein LOC133039746 [Cannabis sativa]